MAKYIKFLIILTIFIVSLKKTLEMENDEIIIRLQSIIDNKEAPLIGADLAVIKDNKTLFCDSIGKARLNEDESVNKTSNKFTKYRTASISKLFTAIAIWQLEENGLLKMTDEASKYLNFNLSNPNFPEIPITIEKILSHTSSISENGSNYHIPYEHNISEFFINTSNYYYKDSYSKNEPGFFDYMNINYCLLGTIIENITKQRFDIYMTEHVLNPLNITGSYNIYNMSKEVLDEVGTLYYYYYGHWIATTYNFTKGYPHMDFSNYTIGTNGAIFSPQGGLIVSVDELTHLIYMFINNGTYNNNKILKPETMEKMFNIFWKYDKQKKNGNDNDGYIDAYGRGPQVITNIGRNRLHKKKDLNVSGHFAFGSGLFGGLFVDRIKGYGFVYRSNGFCGNPDKYVYDFSPYSKWTIDLIKLADDIGHFEDEINDNGKTYTVYIIIAACVVILIVIVIIIVVIKKKKNKENNNGTIDSPLMKDLE